MTMAYPTAVRKQMRHHLRLRAMSPFLAELNAMSLFLEALNAMLHLLKSTIFLQRSRFNPSENKGALSEPAQYSNYKEASASTTNASISIVQNTLTEGASNMISILLSMAITICTIRRFLPGHVNRSILPAGITRLIFKLKRTGTHSTTTRCKFVLKMKHSIFSAFYNKSIEKLKLLQVLHQVPYLDTHISGQYLETRISDFSVRGSVRIYSWRTFPLSSSSFFSLK